MADFDDKLDLALERTGKLSCLAAAWLVIGLVILLIVSALIFGSSE